MKIDRDKIKNKFDGCCAYCGIELKKGWHADHVNPIYRDVVDKPERAGTDTEDNMYPSCPRCNRWKSVFTVEIFRREISKQIERLRKTSPGFRLSEDYGLIKDLNNPVVFLFESYNK